MDKDELFSIQSALIDVLGEGNTDETWAGCAERILRERNAYRAKYRRLRRLLEKVLRMTND